MSDDDVDGATEPAAALADLLAQAEAALQERRLDDCGALLAAAAAADGASPPDRRRLALAAEHAGRTGQAAAAIAYWEAIRSHHSFAGNDWYAHAEQLVAVGRIDDALATLADLRINPLMAVGAMIGATRVYEAVEAWPQALSLWERVVAESGDGKRGVRAYHGRGQLYLRINQIAEAIADFSTATARWPAESRGYEGLFEAFIACRSFPAAQAVLEDCRRRFAGAPWLLLCEARFANETADERGLARFCRRHLLSPDISDGLCIEALRVLLRSRGYRLTDDGRYGIRKVFAENKERQARVRRVLQVTAGIWEAATETVDRTRERIAAMAPELRAGPAGIVQRAKLAEALVQTEQRDAALAEAAAIEADTAAWPAVPAAASILLEWLAVERGELARAKARYWSRRSHVAPADRTCELAPIRRTGAESAVVVFAQVRNEAVSLPHFLRHYRRLGVGRFVFVDNGSEDDTIDLLAAEHDVELYQTFSGFRRAGAGNDWLCPLIGSGRYADTLCIRVDADELLVYAGYEKRPISDLWAHMRARGAEAIGGPMIDMYPERLRDIESGDHVALSCYFDRDLMMRPAVICPYVEYFGGVRSRILQGQRQLLGKVPAIRGGMAVMPDRNSMHYASPAAMSDVSCALLHYKFRPGFIEKAKVEVQRKEYGGAAQSFAGLITVESRQDETLISDQSVIYQSSAQLVELGVLRTTAEWDRG